METLGIGFVVSCIVIVLLKAYLPLFTKEDKTLLISDEELLLVFYDGRPLELSVLISRVDAMYGVLPSSSELAARFKVLINKRELKKTEIVEDLGLDCDDTNEFPRKTILYSRV